LKNLSVKAFLLLKLFVFYFNFGLLACFFLKPNFEFYLPALAAGIFYSLPGLLVIPWEPYVLGMISLSVVFGIYVVGLALEKYLADQRRTHEFK
jgi:hypothetical protein